MVVLSALTSRLGSRTLATAKNVLMSFAVKGLSLIVSLVSMPVLVGYFPDRTLLGLWFAAISIVNWILTLDLGVGNGLRNSLVFELGRGDRDGARRSLSGTYAASTLIAVILMIAGIAAILLVDWSALLNVGADHIPQRDLRAVIGILIGGVLLQSVLRVVSFVLYALQRPAVNNMMALATSTLILLAAVVLPHTGDAAAAIRLAVAYLIAANLPLAVATVLVFGGPLRGLTPDPRKMNRETIRGALQAGGIFFYNQIGFLLIMGSSTFLITVLVGPLAAADYQMYYTLFSLVGAVVMLALSPLWSAVTLALAEGDLRWIDRGVRLAETAVLGAVVIEIALALVAPWIFQLWLGPQSPSVDWINRAALAAFGSAFVWHGVMATYAAGLSKLRLQAAAYTAGALLKFAVAFVVVPLLGQWAIIPLLDAAILGSYCLAERVSIRRRLRAQLAAHPALAGGPITAAQEMPAAKMAESLNIRQIRSRSRKDRRRRT